MLKLELFPLLENETALKAFICPLRKHTKMNPRKHQVGFFFLAQLLQK